MFLFLINGQVIIVYNFDEFGKFSEQYIEFLHAD